MNLFYLRGIIDQLKDAPGCEALKKVTIHDIWIACSPYVIVMYVALAMVLAFPELATWLPSHMR
jgi:TRAP-type mannitol/chloroaromatic compound transport system permease large subunit